MKTDLFEMVDMDYLFTVITADRAVEYTGKEVYVADSIKSLENVIKDGTTRTLEGINSTLCELRFNVHNDDCTTSSYALCVPADKVHKIEKQLRPFRNLDEFEFETSKVIGDIITFRSLYNKEQITTVITEMIERKNEAQTIGLGTRLYPLDTLFKNYEWKDETGTWHPFGVEE